MAQTYTITLSDAQDKALNYAALSPQEWIENAVFEYCRSTIEKIALAEIERKMAAGETISGTKEDLVLAADIKTAAQRNADAAI